MSGRAIRMIRQLGLTALFAAIFALSTVSSRAATITVTHWGAAFYGAPYAVAMATGYVKANGVDITGILTSPGGGTSVRNTLASGLPFGEVALSAAVEAINHGEPLEIIGGGVDNVSDIVWIAKPGSTLHGVKSLIGKKVGYTSPGSVTNMLILMALKANHISPSQVHLIAAGGIGANLTAVLSGALDSAMTGEPVWSENESKIQPVFWVKDVLPPRMMQTVLITTKAFADSSKGAKDLRAIIEGRQQGVTFLYAHPDEAADITAKAYNGDAKLYEKVFRHLANLHYWSDGRLDYAGMNEMVEGLQIVGQQKGPVDWAKIVNASFLPADLKAASK
ncbi:MAG: ABC transporter substrate-binding protein [Acetobacteraceae bacterium]